MACVLLHQRFRNHHAGKQYPELANHFRGGRGSRIPVHLQSVAIRAIEWVLDFVYRPIHQTPNPGLTMTYLEPLQAATAVLVLGWAVIAGYLGDPKLRSVGLVVLAGMGFIVCTTNFQATGNLGAIVAAWVCVVIGGLEAKKLRNRPNRAERKLWRQLFPQIGFWGMIIHDPRRNPK